MNLDHLGPLAIWLVILMLSIDSNEAGVIKNIFQKITHTGNKTEEIVKESAPICGSGLFSTSDERSVSPEFIFITSRPSRATGSSHNTNDNQGYSSSNHQNNNHQNNYNNYNNYDRNTRETSSRRQDHRNVDEVALEFRFHEENVTLNDLEAHGFNRDAPVTFLMHGFTSGYPLQAWISAIVESYTIDRQSKSHSNSRQDELVDHNLFIINWNYAARGILYPRAVANIPIVATYATRFINDKLLREARIDPSRIQLIGHSLGAHLAGFIGKNTNEKLGRIYGLDPAGPCFGSISGPLYPASKRLGPSDSQDVITIHTNSALLGIDRPLGRHSVFVEGGATQPGCKGGDNGLLKSIGTLTWDGGDFDTVACSHSRAPNLLTYRHDQRDTQNDCQMVAYECKDWNSFLAGHCGVCGSSSSGSSQGSGRNQKNKRPDESVECIRIGLDWQYPQSSGSHHNNHQFGHSNSNGGNSQHSRDPQTSRRPSGNTNYDDYPSGSGSQYSRLPSTSRRPSTGEEYESGYSNNNDQSSHGSSQYSREPQTSRRPSGGNSNGYNDYSTSGSSSYSRHESTTSSRRPNTSYQQTGGSNYNQQGGDSQYSRDQSTSRRPYVGGQHQNVHDAGSQPYRRPSYSQRDKRFAGADGKNQYQNQTIGASATSGVNSSSTPTSETRSLFGGSRNEDSSVEAISMFMRTGDTQPYCSYHYQVILTLSEPFEGRSKPPMSIILQDSESDRKSGGDSNVSGNGNSNSYDSSNNNGDRYNNRERTRRASRQEQNSLSNDEFGNKFDDRTYTHLLTSSKKLKRIDHATLLFRNGIPGGKRVLKELRINYMSHQDPQVRSRLSSHLCLANTESDQREQQSPGLKGNRFYFEPCTGGASNLSGGHHG